MFSPMWRGAKLPATVVGLAFGVWIVTGAAAFVHGGGGGGGGHGGGGHGGGGHAGGGHAGGGHHGGGAYHGGGGYYQNGYGYYGGFYPGFYFGSGYYGYPDYGYGYGYGTGYSYPYDNSGYVDSYPTSTVANPVFAVPAPGRYLGIDEQAVSDPGGQGMKVVQVYPGSPAEQAGLQPGDVIMSANGYLMQQSGNLAWIIATVPPNGALQLNVRTARTVQCMW